MASMVSVKRTRDSRSRDATCDRKTKIDLDYPGIRRRPSDAKISRRLELCGLRSGPGESRTVGHDGAANHEFADFAAWHFSDLGISGIVVDGNDSPSNRGESIPDACPGSLLSPRAVSCTTVRDSIEAIGNASVAP